MLLGMNQNNSATLASLLATMSGLSIPQQFPPIIQQPTQPPLNSNTSENLSPSQVHKLILFIHPFRNQRKGQKNEELLNLMYQI